MSDTEKQDPKCEHEGWCINLSLQYKETECGKEDDVKNIFCLQRKCRTKNIHKFPFIHDRLTVTHQ